MTEEAVQEAAVEEAPSQELMEEVVEEAAEAAEASEEPTEPERPDFSRQFAALARKERALRQKEQEISNLARQREQHEGNSTRLLTCSGWQKKTPQNFLASLELITKT